jgi:heme/copper-type cytochrome/quinol oxidase subunit 2
MSADQLAIAGIVITLLVGIPAYFVVKNRKTNRQSQNVGKNASGNQAGRDININQ